MIPRRLVGLRVPVLCIVTVLLSIWVHEAGHALAGILTGSRVKAVVLFSFRPHVTLEGAAGQEHTPFKAAAGTGLFLGVWAVFLVFAPTTAGAAAMVSASAVIAFVESCGWLLSAFLYPHGPKSEDAWKFLRHSGVNPMAAAGVASIVGLIALRIFLHGRPSIMKPLPHPAPNT